MYVVFCRSLLSLCSFYFCHCVVCPFSIYGYWLPLWYLNFSYGGCMYSYNMTLPVYLPVWWWCMYSYHIWHYLMSSCLMVVYVFLTYDIGLMSSCLIVVYVFLSIWHWLYVFLSYGGVCIPTIWHYLYVFLSYGCVCIATVCHYLYVFPSYGSVCIPTIWHYRYIFLSDGGVCIPTIYDITLCVPVLWWCMYS